MGSGTRTWSIKLGLEVAIAGALLGTGLQAYQARRQEKAAEKAQKRQFEEQSRLEQEYRGRLAARDEDQTSAAAAARDRQRAAAAGATGRRSTILTSPLGLPGEPETGRKTLLGA